MIHGPNCTVGITYRCIRRIDENNRIASTSDVLEVIFTAVTKHLGDAIVKAILTIRNTLMTLGYMVTIDAHSAGSIGINTAAVRL
jgi:hypothetical protein